jgi:hypothetical protein
MCELCDESEDGLVYCQDCGRLICFDNEPNNVDVVDQAYVTASGDLFCRRCGSQYDEDEESYYDEEYDGWEYDPFDGIVPAAEGQEE